MLGRLILVLHWLSFGVFCCGVLYLVNQLGSINSREETKIVLLVVQYPALIVIRWILQSKWIWFPWQYRKETFYLVMHWLAFIAFFGTWIFVISVKLKQPDPNWSSFPNHILNALQLNKGFGGFLYTSTMTWLPVSFLFIDYFIHRKWIWFPWQRNKD